MSDTAPAPHLLRTKLYIPRVHPDLVARLQTLPFPGNVREVKNLVWQIASELGGTGSEITWQMLPPDLQTLESSGAPPASGTRVASVLDHSIAEARQLRELCQQHQGDVTAIAKALGVHRTTVIRRLNAYGITYTRRRMSYPIREDHHDLAAAVVSNASGSPVKH